jgi:hypothetical protein
MSATTAFCLFLLAAWCVVAIAICIRDWRAIHDGRSSEIEWEDGE